MLRHVIVVTLLAMGVRPAAAQAPYRVTWWDAASLATATALAIIPEATGLPHGRPACAPCDPATLPGIDRVALHTFSGSAATASTVLVAGLAGFAGLASLDGASARAVRGRAAVFANALAWSFAATEWLKVVVHRDRPVLYTAAAPAAVSDPDTRRSFPSAHTAFAFALATSYSALAARERLPHRTRNAVLLYAGAVGVAALRVAAGQHFPTDVLGGAALGGGIGWLAARLHPTERP
ncbi:MAG TPA: phosphatase PAP2 family protein [Gemmatimonadales bacterium]|jgi:undecaprenyl-diphosphatase|nr:phosphatase PAP2 family protein [Gemmatimonadales bacterium]